MPRRPSIFDTISILAMIYSILYYIIQLIFITIVLVTVTPSNFAEYINIFVPKFKEK